MVTIIVDCTKSHYKFPEYWKPLQLKHAKMEFIFNEHSDLYAIEKANNKHVFITTTNLVPTYETMIKLEILKANTILTPKTFIGLSTKCNAASYERDKCLEIGDDFSMKSYIDKYNPEIIEKGTMYSV